MLKGMLEIVFNKDNGMWPIVIVVVALTLGIGSKFMFKKPDNPIEQASEAVLRSQGIDIDFSAAQKSEQNSKDAEKE